MPLLRLSAMKRSSCFGSVIPTLKSPSVARITRFTASRSKCRSANAYARCRPSPPAGEVVTAESDVQELVLSGPWRRHDRMRDSKWLGAVLRKGVSVGKVVDHFL